MDHDLSHYEVGSILEIELYSKTEELLFIIAEKDDDYDLRYLVNLKDGSRYHIQAALFKSDYSNIHSIIIKRGGLKDEHKTWF